MKAPDFLFSLILVCVSTVGVTVILSTSCATTQPSIKPAMLMGDTTLQQEWQSWSEIVEELSQLALKDRPVGGQIPLHELQRMQELVAIMRDLLDPAHLAKLEKRVANIERYLLAVHTAAVEAAK